MMRAIIPIVVLSLAACTAEQHQVVLAPENGVVDLPAGSTELKVSYGNVPIVFSEEQSGSESYYVQEIEHQREDVVFRVKKIPTPLYVKKENPAMTDSALHAALAELEGEQVFYFELEEELRQDLLKKYHKDNYENAVEYFSFGIANDLRIHTADGDTLHPSFTLFERNFHLAPFERIIVDFNGLDPNQAFELVYYDRMFGKGEVVFRFPDQKFVDQNLNALL